MKNECEPILNKNLPHTNIIREYKRGEGGLLYSGLEWLMGLLFNLILMSPCPLSLP
jgi:hypothetical protein